MRRRKSIHEYPKSHETESCAFIDEPDVGGVEREKGESWIFLVVLLFFQCGFCVSCIDFVSNPQ